MRIFRINSEKNEELQNSVLRSLAKASRLAEGTVSDAAIKGAIWIQKGGRSTIERIRSLDIKLGRQDQVTFYYEPRILNLPELKYAECLYQSKQYSIWHKAAGVLSQGSQTGDHVSLLRYIEKQTKDPVFLVHRLDRETEGVMVFAHSSKAAGKLSQMFQNNEMKKRYLAVVLGEMSPGSKATISEPLDGKAAVTHYQVLNTLNGKSLLEIFIDTGRLHQIRRHLDFIGHPIIGDSKYGKGNKNKDGLKLLAQGMSFIDPWTNKSVHYELSQLLSV